MLRISALLALLISGSAQAAFPNFPGTDFSGIFAGTPMTQNDFGWKSTVFVKLATGRCTGTLISPTAVVTAAHCAVNTPEQVAFFNGKNLVDPRKVKAYKIHPGYSTSPQGWSEHNDIAVLRLESPVSSRYVPVPLLQDINLLRGSVLMEGFGRSGPGGANSGLTRATLNVMGMDSGGYFVQLSDGIGKQAACVGDSGGPSYIQIGEQKYLAAVTSFINAEDKNCSSGTHATFSLVVVNYLKWIEESLKEI